MKRAFKKIAILAGFLLLVAGSTYGQMFQPHYPDRKEWRFGLKGGVSFTNFRYGERNLELNSALNSKTAVTFRVGAVLENQMTDWAAIQTGVTIAKEGADIKQKGNEGKFLYEMRPVFFEVPVNLVFRPRISYTTDFYFGAGPYVAFAVGGKGDYNGPADLFDYYTDGKLKFGNKASKDLRSLDAGFNFMAGLEFSSTLSLGAEYGLGVRNISPKKNSNAPGIIKNRGLNIMLTIMFGGENGFFFR